MKFTSALYSLLILSLMSSCYYTEEADILIHNANIYTVDAAFSKAEAMAIKDGKIIDIGPNNEMKNRYQAKEEIDAKLRPIYPGFIDAHCHFLWYGNGFYEVDLGGSKSWDEVIERTKAFAEANQDLWVVGMGWDQNDWEVKEFPTKAKLDSLFPDRAVLLRRIDGHAAIANQKALDLAGITETSEIEGGVYQKIEGKLSGILIDNAIGSVDNAKPFLSFSQMERALLKAQTMCFEKGLTSVSDAMLENEMVHAIDSLHKSGALKMKVYGMLTPTEANKKEFLEKGHYLTERLTIRAFKYFADGALGSRGAKLIEPYDDDPENTGLFLSEKEYFEEEAKAVYAAGFQMNTHCIGDGANQMVLDVYASVLNGTNDRRWRIEHAQIVQPSDLEKFKANTIIPSVQPTHATSDMHWVHHRIGHARSKTAYAWKDLLEMNGLIALGTDFPIEDIDPLKTFFAATIRKDADFTPEEGFQMENSLTREETLKGMTIWAAISNFEEATKGSLEVGKDADFIMLDQDIMTADEKDILGTKVLYTYVNGEKVFEFKK